MAPEPAGRCPQCGKPADAGFKPFCSKRCADLDLGAWLKGSYVIPGSPVNPGTPVENGPDED